jgi:geranylgeranyl diphosphate synthase, type II
MTIETYIQEKKELIDEHLHTYLDLPAENQPQQQLIDAMKYSLFAGGKRIRPILCLAVNELFTPNSEAALPLAISLEMIHTYSLIHDDLPCMDNDDMRRGKPTCHTVYGEAIALLAGNALLSLAFSIASHATALSCDKIVLVLKELADSSGYNGLMGGQAADILMEGTSPDTTMLKYIHLNKTARLFQTATTLGGLAVDTTEGDVCTLKEFGTLLGWAFQLQDDILDATGDEKKTGKRLRKDDHKLSAINVIGLEQAKLLHTKTIEETLILLDRYGEKAQLLKDLVQHIAQREH